MIKRSKLNIFIIFIIIGLAIFIVFIVSNQKIEKTSPIKLADQSNYLNYTYNDEQPRTIKYDLDFLLSMNDLNIRLGEEKKIKFGILIEDEHNSSDKEKILELIAGNVGYEIEDNSILRMENDNIITLKNGTTKVIASVYKNIPPTDKCYKCNVIKQIKTEFNVTIHS